MLGIATAFGASLRCAGEVCASPDQLDSERFIVGDSAVQFHPAAIRCHGHRSRRSRRRQAYTVSQRQTNVARGITPGAEQNTAKLSLLCCKLRLDFQMEFAEGGDGLFRRHSGTDQPSNDFGQIDSVDSRVIQNAVHALPARFIQQDAQQGGGIENKRRFHGRETSSVSRSTSSRRS